ncbi:MAG: thiamine pyrophosphate-dependent enzyme [Candidatus Limnocylindrales bacterium]|jgi:pyruvate/2-oxoacid:ferredoxin oxidoreductase beta subunit/Pyruvate/2-oxoacid:ferredoxin oxidoreductase delta subunit
MTDTIADTNIEKLGAGPGLIAPQTLDIADYVDDFNRNVIDAYRRGVADVDLPADRGVARSLIAPATAGVRDFSTLSPLIPQLTAEKCVGCMACVSACPDSAIMATAQPKTSLAMAIDGFAAAQKDPKLAAETVRQHFVHTTKYADVPAKKGIEGADFGLFIDPYHCKGCAECVDVCVAQGHDALAMIEKCDAEASGECTLDRYRRDIAFYKSLPPTPVEYRNEKVLADLMLGENAFGFVGGAGSCSGCGEGTVVRMVVAATLQTYGPQSMGIVAETGCNTVFGSTYPFNPFTVPWTNSLFENGPADAMGIRLRWDQAGHEDRRLWVFGGDGAMYDIGFQSLSRLVSSGMDVKVLVLDTGVYSNTGGQTSTASFTSQVAKLSAYGKAEHGKSEKRKELGRILMAHGDVYVAQVAACTINHLYKAVMEANAYPGPAVIVAYTPCMPEHGIADDAANRQAKLAVDSRAFPLFTYDPRRGNSLAERLSLQGNPAVKEDWTKNPDGTTFDFISFARTEGRFSQHFDKEGNPSVELQRSQEDRLQDWKVLQEMAGVLRTGH